MDMTSTKHAITGFAFQVNRCKESTVNEYSVPRSAWLPASVKRASQESDTLAQCPTSISWSKFNLCRSTSAILEDLLCTKLTIKCILTCYCSISVTLMTTHKTVELLSIHVFFLYKISILYILYIRGLIGSTFFVTIYRPKI